MLPRLAVLACACLLAQNALAAAPPPKLTITAEAIYPGVMIVEGKVHGHAADKVHEIMRRSGFDYRIDILPWKRAYTQATLQADTCVFMTTRTPEREQLFQWVGPISRADWVLFGRAGRNYAIKTLEDARALRIGAYNGDMRGEFLAARGFRVEFVQNDESNPKKLLLDRIDLWVNSTRSAQPMLMRPELAGKIVPVLTFQRVELYLACNAGLDRALVARMNGALRAMEADGTFKAIERRYEHLQRAPGATR